MKISSGVEKIDEGAAMMEELRIFQEVTKTQNY